MLIGAPEEDKGWTTDSHKELTQGSPAIKQRDAKKHNLKLHLQSLTFFQSRNNASSSHQSVLSLNSVLLTSTVSKFDTAEPTGALLLVKLQPSTRVTPDVRIAPPVRPESKHEIIRNSGREVSDNVCLGTPVDTSLFRQLRRAPPSLAPPAEGNYQRSFTGHWRYRLSTSFGWC